MKSHQITIKDIAKVLGISASTVSRALQDHPDISKSTKEAVNTYAKKHNYKPNAIALSLKNQRTNIIGVLVPEMIHHFFSSVLSGIEDAANKKGFNVIVCQTAEDYEKEVKTVNTLISSRACGVLASISKETTNYEHFQELIDGGTPLVFFDRICTGIANTDRVVADDYTGARNAVEHLIKKGCKRIAFFSTPANLEITKNRKNGYCDALSQHKIAIDEDLIYTCDDRQPAIKLTKKILEGKGPKPDGFFAVNDATASGIIYSVKRANYRIPEDIAVCGFGDGVIAKTSDPTLTTVQQNGYDMGLEACNILIRRIEEENNTDSQPIHSVIRTSLVVRESTEI